MGLPKKKLIVVISSECSIIPVYCIYIFFLIKNETKLLNFGYFFFLLNVENQSILTKMS